MKSFCAIALAGLVAAKRHPIQDSNIEIDNIKDNETIYRLVRSFSEWASLHGKSYADLAEYKYRLNNFWKTEKAMQAAKSIKDTFHMAHNKFSDLNEEEFEYYQGEIKDDDEEDVETLAYTNEETNGTIDWRSRGAVNPIQNQSSCGSCWAFNAVATFEGAYQIAHGQLIKFSEQQLVDCDTKSHGCDGGSKTRGFTYLQSHYAMRGSDYPYKKVQGSCKYSSSKATSAQVASYSHVTASSTSALKSALNKQPVAVSVRAHESVFKNYSSGIMNSSKCGTDTTHSVTAVGYGTNYYIVRNSWGTGWGEKGYIRIEFSSGLGICGVQSSPAVPKSK